MADAGGPLSQGVATPQDVKQAVQWSLRSPTAVDLGLCRELGRVAPGAAVDVGSAMNEKAGPAGGAVADSGPVAPPELIHTWRAP